jgi:hypothetical protein
MLSFALVWFKKQRIQNNVVDFELKKGVVILTTSYQNSSFERLD